jgi:ribosome-associated toxin RatA of RatAB toxin-antitoxin module
MGIETSGRETIDAPPEVCFRAAADFDRWPEWANEVERVAILERDEGGRGRRVTFWVELFSKEYNATVDFDYTRAPELFSWDLVEARKFRTLTGSFQFEPEGDGTLLRFRLNGELVKPKAARLERMFGRRIETIVLRGLRRHIERNVVRGR